MVNTKKNYDIIDLFKFIASIFILSMHANVFESVNCNLQFYLVQLLSRWGVPFFFTISSYFLFNREANGNITKEQLIIYVKRLAMLYLAWFILNILYIAYNLYTDDITSIKTWLKFVFNAIVSSTFMGSWYLTCSIFSAVVVWLLSKKIKTIYIFCITFIVYLFCVLTSAYKNVIGLDLTSICNTILAGGVFYSLGKLIVENKDKLFKIKKSTLFCISALFYILYYTEMSLLKIYNYSPTTDTSIFLVPFALFFVLLLLKINLKIKGAVYLRKASTIIYCSQGTILLLSKIISNNIFNLSHTCFYYLFTVIFTITVVLVILYIDKTQKISYIKYLT